ncbi:cytochrome ubiquinol oxidase subunit I [Alkalilimnicola ehrlichii]|uniref:Cytochrome ubiquinol oxidase subunit I n=1 Tax=Alkalilimnicola ehrlichii TaxID=351052 RepID=A0A3E0WIS3_9GAMM|nr:cytochrome ubiquinol oxidase subunit I [Alkalilimnicola ehrlichii]RFA26155.1 cytochrome ubiquinol oxidase subunit I [Alkalilimnicola ehrlichii]RFA32349.1 cytochrome ubiquinol oxidase subunit I [Alkalilimnicola ehrlichii]
MEFDPIFLSRVQFAFVISFHVLFPAFTVGLASWIAVLETLWWKTDREIYIRLSQFWTKIFAVSFGMGVVSGIVMSFQFGTNWSLFADASANILGPLLAYEVLTAFFLEATFLGILLFGRNRVPRPLHVFASYMVALGTLISTFWILSANSWMQTPAGFIYEEGRFFVDSWIEAIFNPSFPYRLTHMVAGTMLTTAFVVSGVSALYLLQNRFQEHARIGLSMGMGMIAVVAPLQIFLGDLHGLNTLEHQPVKVAAMEGHWETQRGQPAILFAIPDAENETNRFEIGIPNLGSLILTHEWEGEVQGLREWAAEDRPPVAPVFYAFRIMVFIGFLMLAVGIISLYLRYRGRLYDTPWFLKLCVGCIPIGFIAIMAGWFTTEIGRQPWIIYDFMRTEDAVSPGISGGNVITSLAVFFIAYAIVFGAGVYYLSRLINKGPEHPTTGHPLRGARRPLSVADRFDEED